MSSKGKKSKNNLGRRIKDYDAMMKSSKFESGTHPQGYRKPGSEKRSGASA